MVGVPCIWGGVCHLIQCELLMGMPNLVASQNTFPSVGSRKTVRCYHCLISFCRYHHDHPIIFGWYHHNHPISFYRYHHDHWISFCLYHHDHPISYCRYHHDHPIVFVGTTLDLWRYLFFSTESISTGAQYVFPESLIRCEKVKK